jgi:ComF family protein
MWWYLSKLLDYCFPSTQDELLLKACSDHQFNLLYQPTTHAGVHTLLPFHQPVVRAAIHLTKYKAHPRATMLLSSILNRHLSHYDYPVILIPIPLSTERHRDRGYNQVTMVATMAVAECEDVTINTTVLVRTKHTKPQTSLTKKERAENLHDAFVLSNKAATELSGKHVILVDDVHTTGATLKAARAVLAPLQLASLTCVALAH